MLYLSKKMRAFPYLLILPAFLLIIIFKLYPILLTLIDSVIVDSNFSLSAFTDIFTDKSFWNSFSITLKMNIVMIPIQVLLSLSLAIIISLDIKGMGFFRTIFYLPVTISITIACLVWKVMLNPDTGIVNSILNFMGITSQGFFTDTNQALWSIVLVATWKGVGYWMMFFLAGLKNIDQSIYESAEIDGASWVTMLTKITLPLLKKVTLFVFIANTTANLLLFVPMQLLTNGGPQESTNVLMFEAYQAAFKYGDRARSSSIILVLLVLIIMFVVLQAFLLREDKNE